MPAHKKLEDPLDVIKHLDKRMRVLEQSRRFSSFIGAQIRKGGNQTITTGIGPVTQVSFSGADFDTDLFFDNISNVLTIPTDLQGYYMLYCKVEWDTGTGQMILRGRINNTAFTETHSGSVTGMATSHFFTPIVHYMAEGDYFDIGVSHNQGTDRDVLGSGDDFDTYMGMYYLGR